MYWLIACATVISMLRLRCNGRNKITLLRAQLEAKAAGIVSGDKPTPLEVLLHLMNEAFTEYKEAQNLLALDEKLHPPEDEASQKARRELWSKMKAARNLAMDAAVAAAPYVHPKLQAIDQTVKKGVIVTVKEYKFDGEGEPPVE